MPKALGVLVLVGAIVSWGCTKSQPKPALSPEETKVQALLDKGHASYLATCVACHNIDPKLDGAVGPAIAGSARDLIEARVLHAAYPAGYTPKRSTHAMPAFPQLANDIEGLAAYLASVAKDASK